MRGVWEVLQRSSRWLLPCAAMLAAAPAFPGSPGDSKAAPATGSSPVAAGPTDLLDAEADGLVAVRYIPNNSRSAQIIVTNRSNRPLTLRLPAAFVGMPVLAQMAGGGFGGGAQPQAVGGGAGGGMGAGMGAAGGMGGAGAAFSIPPEKTRVLKVPTVCLEHGRAEPAARHPYRLDRYESYSSDPALRGILESFGRGEIAPQVAQAAAWHLSSGLSWERLAAERIDHLVEEDEPFFTEEEIVLARGAVEVAARAAARGSSRSVTGRSE